MKKLNLILIVLIGLTILSCSPDENELITEPFQLKLFNNAYAEVYTGNVSECNASLILTNKPVPKNSNNHILPFGNSENSHVVIFRKIRIDNCDDINPSVRVFDLQFGLESELNSMSIPLVYYDMTYDNDGVVTSSADYLDVTYAKLKVNSNNSIDFEIRLEDGTILTQSYTGEIDTYTVEL